MCQQTCHTHLQCQLPGEAESSPTAQGFRFGGCPALTCPCQEPGCHTLSFLTPHLSPLTPHLSASQSQSQVCIFHLISPSNPLSNYSSLHFILNSSRPSPTALRMEPLPGTRCLQGTSQTRLLQVQSSSWSASCSSALSLDMC